MDIRRGHVYLVDFNPRVKTKPGKVRPAIVLQADAVSEAEYPSTVVVPTTTQLVEDAGLLRLRLDAGTAGIEHDSDILIGQIIAVANESFKRRLGFLDADLMGELDRRVKIILDLEK
jgi:mRNA interferase MazF